MIQALTYNPKTGFHLGDDIEAARRALDEHDTMLWLDLEGEPCNVIQRVGELFDLNAGAIDDADDDDQRPRIDDYGDYLFILMYASLAPENPPTFSPRQLSLFLGRGFLITVHNQPIRAVTTTMARAKRMPERALSRGMDFIFFHIADYLVDNFVVCAESYEEKLDDLDECSMQPDVHHEIIQELTQLQRTLIRMRRMISAQRELAAQIAGGEYEFVSAEVDRRFEHIYQHLTHAFELIEGMRETAHSIRDNYYAVLAERTNSLMRTLTIFSTFIMPMTLVTGFFGMNVDLLLPADSPISLIVAFLLMFISGASMIVYFKRRHWI